MAGAAWWEPWTPTVGQRVRIRLSEECDQVGHSRQEDGVVSTIVEIDPSGGGVGHPYAVTFDPPIVDGQIPGYVNWFAAIELEPVDD